MKQKFSYVGHQAVHYCEPWERGKKINGATQTKSGRLTVLMRQWSKFTQAKGAWVCKAGHQRGGNFRERMHSGEEQHQTVG